MKSSFELCRRTFHKKLLDSVLTKDSDGIPSIADKDQRLSREVASLLVEKLGACRVAKKVSGQQAGNQFESICLEFVSDCFGKLTHLRPGNWQCRQITNRSSGISEFEQYNHMSELDELADKYTELATTLGNTYAIAPDLIVSLEPYTDSEINRTDSLVDDSVSQLTSLRAKNNKKPLLLASISCKWTLRSDRAQNARSEALNLIRNRKGRCPHIVAVTAEPTPSRISSLALGTGDLDCVYHFALDELRESIAELDGQDDPLQLLDIMIEGKRLRDISDLPLDLLA